MTEIVPTPENTEIPAGTVITSIVNFDPNITYTLEGDDASLYEIDSETGEIKVVEAYTPDYETKDAYNIVVKAVDADGNELGSQNVTVPVEDIEPEGTDFELTTESDDVVIGTAGDDTFNAVVSSLSSEKTLSSTDSIDGGDGDDTLNVTLKSSFTGFAEDAGVTNVENINLINDSTIARSFDATGVTGAETYTLNSETAAISDISNLENSVDITINGQSSGSFETTFADEAAEVSGTEDKMKVTLNNVGTAETDDVDEEAVDLTLTDIEDVTLVSSGDNNVVNFKGEDLKSLNIEGISNVKISEVTTSLESINALGLTGNLTADLSNADGLKSLETGEGADDITIAADKTIPDMTLSGGGGEDTLTIASSGSATTSYELIGFETLEIGDIGGDLTFSGENVSDVSNIVITQDAGSNVEFTKVSVSDLTLNVSACYTRY